MRSNSNGLTLIELMVVLAIIGILAMIAIPNFISYRNRSRVASAVGTCEAIRTAMASYAADAPGNLFPVDEWEDGVAGWKDFRQVMIPNGITLKMDMTEQGFRDFIYRTIEYYDDGDDYFFVFQCGTVPSDKTGALIEVRPSGIARWSGSL